MNTHILFIIRIYIIITNYLTLYMFDFCLNILKVVTLKLINNCYKNEIINDNIRLIFYTHTSNYATLH